MKKVLLLCCGLWLGATVFAQSAPAIALIPEPVSITTGTGRFVLPQNLVIGADKNSALAHTASMLQQKLSAPTGYTVTVSASEGNPAIRLQLLQNKDAQLGKEGYKLSVTNNGVTVAANEPAGVFYGVQSLLQLLPKDIESKEKVTGATWDMPVVEVTDYPRFGWRGLMFDVSRHFFTKEDVKQYIDQMVRYKYNLLHLHLTDDEGWRIEIKSLPKLTEVGAWNAKKVGYFGTFSKPEPNEPRNYGGFYTQEDLKELVRYAQDRFVNILPEVDVPGHSLAAIAAYPELACSAGKGPKPEVSSGQSIKDWSKHVALIDDNLCPANEAVYTFLDKVVGEMAQIFPFEYIHMGGDETFKTFWKDDPAIKALMQREKLKTMEEVQSYFTRRVEKIVASKGKKLMGWDEILEGGIAPSAAVMSWRGMKGGIEAAKMKHEVVMSPTDFAYIDYMQGDVLVEPRIYATLRLNKAYQFDPLPEGVDPKYIKGGQANLWTEQVYNMRHAQYMTWPRGFAIAEAVWSPKAKRNWDAFMPRVEAHMKRFDVADVKYAPSVFDPIVAVSRTADGKLKIDLTTEVKDLSIHYTFDNSFPDHHYPKVEGSLIIPKDAVMLKVVTYRGKEQKGRVINMPLSELEKRVKKV
ncbi:hexosaminidase [Cnuella takakiae]|uniref:beta-N-acetylhexosaminidase n=1 Tax=Cnuella takakiae TaxID=1302690 RepID=A0A1M5ADN9_9BACT|nr:beta-N-acetylhexosaminidase [Cnuella takakiae]OLY92012.1 beta-N-acetylhexosaminidase [Cnuella takakiae]SHF28022.1 hexosaminidase [Cnuella takakiae]